MKLGMGGTRVRLTVFLHARRELDVEVFDRELAGDQAREEEVTGFGETALLLQIKLRSAYQDRPRQCPQTSSNEIFRMAVGFQSS